MSEVARTVRETLTRNRIHDKALMLFLAYLFGCFLASVLIAWIILGNLFTCYGLVRFKPPKNAFGMEKRRRITINYLLRFSVHHTFYYTRNHTMTS